MLNESCGFFDIIMIGKKLICEKCNQTHIIDRYPDLYVGHKYSNID